MRFLLILLAASLSAQQAIIVRRAPVDAAGLPDPAPESYWKISEGSGQQTDDEQVAVNHGQLGSTTGSDGDDPIWVTGGLDFIGADHLDMDNDLTVDWMGEANSFCFVYEPDSTSQDLGLTGEWDNPGWYLRQTSTNGAPEVEIRTVNVSNTLRFRGDTSMSAGTVYFTCWTFPASPTVANSEIYVNGTLQTEITTYDTLSSNPDYAGTEFRLGPTGGATTGNHKIYWAAYWNVELTSGEVGSWCTQAQTDLSGDITVTCD